jgi:hypothetical protein
LACPSYRAATVSLGCEGDSVANALGDILSGTIGHWIASHLRLWRSVALFVVTEAVFFFWIPDSTLLSIVMLIHPIEAIKTTWHCRRKRDPPYNGPEKAP